ncbi:iron-containing redox enzyme family protein [Acinetobacter nosocomialis]|uniref:iron-containing redox enzyme family protein n=1 Tax=Acinetobacter nosocomialis TaxID=106654 RepID=UPI002870A346|nr:iron-containing redox enzyme family protein [Acinetobacter nosocomialis]MDR9576744.1 iron-containing redox enzyme family protein [Acinetobacter nosocomialis]
MPVVVKKRLLDLLQDNQQNYYELFVFFLDPDVSSFEKEKKARDFLIKEIDKLEMTEIDFPSSIDSIKEWCENDNKKNCQEFQAYLNRRQDGHGREYFQNVAQAFEFLIKVSPTKKVDGAWLYSSVHYWNDPVFHELIITYLEELGLGEPKANHVCIYDDLLRSLGLDSFDLLLEDDYYHQAVVQLALGYAPPEFIPEIVGFNLGYEQLPLHLLISNYELAELGIDSKYFNLHITIDNIDNGHAYKAIKVIEDIYNKYRDKELFFIKLKQGFALNNRGESSSNIIKNLSLEDFVHKILKRKALVGQLIHNETRQFGCKTINQWLSNPDDIAGLINHLTEQKSIKFNTDPEQSVFWRMINEENGKMFGVFNPVERQIIHDWIAGSDHSSNFLAYSRELKNSQRIQDYLFSYISDGELDALQERVLQSSDLAIKICKLTPFLAPDSHHKSIGLWSTRKYVELLFPYLGTFKN